MRRSFKGVPVYVDDARNPFGRMFMCHMFADTAAELHDMAAALGLRRYYQCPDAPTKARASFPHYDICLAKRLEAVMLGAIEVDRRGGVEVRRGIRDRIIKDAEFAATWRFKGET
jgi:hypothetical protein